MFQGKENKQRRSTKGAAAAASISKDSKARANLHAGAIQQRGTARAAAVAVESALPYLELPRDDEDWRFVQSFKVHDAAAAREFFDVYGFVVYRDVLTPEESAASRGEILSYIERTREGFSADDESTWHNWRSQQFGMPPPDESAWWQPQLARNRRHPRVATSFAQLLGCEPASLRCSHDRWALYPRGIRTRRNVHLDINPCLYAHGAAAVAERRAEFGYAASDELFGGSDNMVSAECGPHLQGTLALLTNEEQDAGFVCVPGSHAVFDQWEAALPAETAAGGPRYDFPDHSEYHKRAQRVPVREGSLICWDVRLVHGSSPDLSTRSDVATRPRFVQFVALRTARLLGPEQACRRQALVARLHAAHGLEEPCDPLERAVAGLAERVAGTRESAAPAAAVAAAAAAAEEVTALEGAAAAPEVEPRG